MTPIDHINQQAVATYVRETIWPGNKMLPKSYSKWRDDKRSLCQMILKMVELPLAVDRNSYWEAMILAITNNKFCSLRANFMQELFGQFQGKFYSNKHGNDSVTLMRYLSMDKSLTKNCSGSSRNSSQLMYGIHFKIIGIV